MGEVGRRDRGGGKRVVEVEEAGETGRWWFFFPGENKHAVKKQPLGVNELISEHNLFAITRPSWDAVAVLQRGKADLWRVARCQRRDDFHRHFVPTGFAVGKEAALLCVESFFEA